MLARAAQELFVMTEINDQHLADSTGFIDDGIFPRSLERLYLTPSLLAAVPISPFPYFTSCYGLVCMINVSLEQLIRAQGLV